MRFCSSIFTQRLVTDLPYTLTYRAATFGNEDVRTGEIVLCMGLVKFLEGHRDVAIADFQM